MPVPAIEVTVETIHPETMERVERTHIIEDGSLGDERYSAIACLLHAGATVDLPDNLVGYDPYDILGKDGPWTGSDKLLDISLAED
jgi:hypothetical protein